MYNIELNESNRSLYKALFFYNIIETYLISFSLDGVLSKDYKLIAVCVMQGFMHVIKNAIHCYKDMGYNLSSRHFIMLMSLK